MSQKLNGLFDFVLALLVRFASSFPHDSEDQYEARMYVQWGVLYLNALVECYVMDKSQFIAELRHVWADGSVWWVKLFGLDATEGTRTLYVCGLRLQWHTPERHTSVDTRVYSTLDLGNAWAIEYSLPSDPHLVWYEAAGNAIGLGYVLRRIQQQGGTIVRLMRDSAYQRELQNYRAGWQLAADKEAYRADWKLAH